MGDLAKERQRLAKLTDKELNTEFLGNNPYLLDAYRERDYRTGKKLIRLSWALFWLTVGLLVLTIALLGVEVVHYNSK